MLPHNVTLRAIEPRMGILADAGIMVECLPPLAGSQALPPGRGAVYRDLLSSGATTPAPRSPERDRQRYTAAVGVT